MAKGKAKGKAMRKASMSEAPMAYKPPTMRERVAGHADSAVRSLMDEHPMVRKMKSDMASAIHGVIRGAKSTGSARGRSAGPMPRKSVFS